VVPRVVAASAVSAIQYSFRNLVLTPALRFNLKQLPPSRNALPNVNDGEGGAGGPVEAKVARALRRSFPR
jgi:hypothetical protein